MPDAMAQGEIPIRNLYYLLCYAWGRLEEGELVDIDQLPSTELVDLFALVLASGMERLLRRGIEQGYREVEEELAGVRGRVQVLPSARRLLLQHGRALCAFEDLSVDTPANRIVKATIRALLAAPMLDRGLRLRLRNVIRELRDVRDLELHAAVFRRVQLHSNNRSYRFLLSVCEFVYGAWLADEGSGRHRFRDFVRDERRMAKVFEDFVLEFYRRERPDLEVRSEDIAWQAASESDPGLSWLPRMRTDITLRGGHSTLILDTKYYTRTMSSYYDVDKFHAGNLYQLLSYLTNFRCGADEALAGMLLYPQVDRELRADYVVQGFPVRLATVNLAADWRQIRRELLDLLPLQREGARAA